ncbi:MAG TPA: hypothetical protein ENK05_07350 [Gammaproteobacteria bacterium]|nr:hypothetical protein [Gammaproteobacteria bacterium]
MERLQPDPIKQREIAFRDPHPDPQQARSAMLLLSDVEGILSAAIPDLSRNSVHVRYDLRHICLRVIEALLFELGFHLDNSLLSKLKRALYYYTEENELESLASSHGREQNTRDIFMRCYRCKTHGCRDERPEYWRKYL